jgi:putative spermidine/putrescine transport system substrate-binding protein
MQKLAKLTKLMLAICLISIGATTLAQVAVSTWGFNMDLINEHITDTFVEQFETEILYDLGNNADRLTRLQLRSDNPEISVVELAPTFAIRAQREGLLEPIDTSRLANYDALYDWAQDPLGGNYGVGFTVYSYGIVYRTDMVDEPITSWQDLWRDDLAGRVSLPNVTTTQGLATIIMASRAWGGDAQNPDVGFEQLAELSDDVVTFYARSSELVSLFQQGEVWAAPVLRFAWGQLLDTDLPLAWVAPEEGSVGFVNTISIISGAPNTDSAYDYINHRLSQDVQTALALDLVDSPVRSDVDVPAELAEQLTYGEGEIDNLIFLDYNYLLDVESDWIERWNEEIAR